MTGSGQEAGLDPYEFIVEFLGTCERLPWKTTAYLCRVLRKERDYRITPDALERVLLEHMDEGPVRYSQFPGRQSLELIWGHKDNVGALEELWELDLDREQLRDEFGDLEERTVSADAEWVFLSHSFRDFRSVRKLRDDLLDLGYGVWMAETHILDGEQILARVQSGLEGADHFALYATRESIGSRWVLKEGGVAARRWKLPATVIVDRADPKLAEFFRAWVANGWTAETLAQIPQLFPDAPLDPVAATDISQLLVSALAETVADRRRVVLYPEQAEDADGLAERRWYRTLREAFCH